MPKSLQLWNGRMTPPYKHGYVAAYSRADAIRVFEEALGYSARGMDSELKNYWNAGGWGRAMTGIVPERGLWATETNNGEVFRIINGKPEPVVPTPERKAFLEAQAEEVAILRRQRKDRETKERELLVLFTNASQIQGSRENLFDLNLTKLTEDDVRALAGFLSARTSKQ